MDIIHFDVDTELQKYLKGDVRAESLQQIVGREEFLHINCISIKSGSKADKDVLSLFPSLHLLITRTVGTDHIDLDYCRKRGIEVKNILDYGAFNIAEHVFALLLAGTRNILSTQSEIRSGKFTYKGHLSIALKEKTLGVVGTGRIGLEVIARAKAFGMTVIAYDVIQNKKAQEELGYEYVELEKLAGESDIITLHAPFLESTHHIINEKIISTMKDGAVLINTARGELIDTEALVKHISKFRFVGLDVLEGEKTFSNDHPLLKFENVVITPHVAFYSDASVKKIAEETMRIISEFTE
ncbi:MAG: D-isomer specific 2-hydroxyacid dehydrogenase, NAD-binding protein [Candidatus Roizmanbacteria bacterium GW2011_GWA2_37_7]|uniref:D-isomer specific 2-hydroxyacid dehydrogenase, NAD-binding protein n=1 Tax=Candidatus Roizmanbacteria bacterium GW2011_GWA2_37_7 TaxID=1618481 RepID=A0A0G0HCL9_9BACT|nr:MAG: D-isomer specific 2-hydroxyacid dehydrogenase, NAD-binding protein [Candidatus Roizmanbacteria bacterium GW2011_GWA2_37_7]